MASDEILARIDAHMQQGNRLMAEVREEMRLNREEMRLNRLAYAEGHGVMARLTEVLVRIDESQREMRDEMRAQREAFIRLMNRFDGGGSSPATA